MLKENRIGGLAPWQKVYTNEGPEKVETLAKKGRFVALCWDGKKGRMAAKWAEIRPEKGKRAVVRISTDKGTFCMSKEHPVRGADGKERPAGELKKGMRLHAGSVHKSNGKYLEVGLQNKQKGKLRFQRLIAQDIMRRKIQGMDVHHLDGDTMNNSLKNLRLMTPTEHSRLHTKETNAAKLKSGEHNFLTDNPATEWWACRAGKQSKKALKSAFEKGRALDYQRRSTKAQMLKRLWASLNENPQIKTLQDYTEFRKLAPSKARSLKVSIRTHFGSFPRMLKEASKRNHKISGIRPAGAERTFAATVERGENILLWSNANPNKYGTGIFVGAPKQ